MELQSLVEFCIKNAPLVPDQSFLLEYGTAGFRTKASKLHGVVWRMGLLAGYASKSTNGEPFGIMVTASHNPVEDNGVKLIDFQGRMISVEWENLAGRLVSAGDEPTALSAVLEEVLSLVNKDCVGCVSLGWDTRPSSLELVEQASYGIAVSGSQSIRFGAVTTPQLHYMLWLRSRGIIQDFSPDSVEPSLNCYYVRLAEAFSTLLCDVEIDHITDVWVDCAHGIGAAALEKLSSALSLCKAPLRLHAVNKPSDGILNFECGADFVKVRQAPPAGLILKPGRHYASLDGDADRLIYFFVTASEPREFRLLDGDKLATLLTGWLSHQLRIAKLDKRLRLGLVQTAYANSASTIYASSVQDVEVLFACTGVKYLHKLAESSFDIGVYFEANGHGTVLYSDKTHELLENELKKSAETDVHVAKAVKRLWNFMQLTNEAVGDALSDLLLVEAVLTLNSCDLPQWYEQYTDLPNRQLKVLVADRRVISTTDAERRCVTPVGLQEALDSLIATESNRFVRCFARPSGTENVVRIYAEGRNEQKDADDLAVEAARCVHRLAGGVGPEP